LDWNNNRFINIILSRPLLNAYKKAEKDFHEISYKRWEEMLNRFSFILNRTVLKKTIGPSASISELIGVYIFTLRITCSFFLGS